jgi:hypothetical protein
MTSNHDELERLARAAAAQTKPDEAEWFCREAIEMLSGNDEDAAFIAAANPATILALLSDNREMRAALESAAETLDHVDGALMDMADAGAVPAVGTWRFVTQAAKRARSALTTQRGDGE